MLTLTKLGIICIFISLWIHSNGECSSYSNCDKCLSVDHNDTCAWCESSLTCINSSHTGDCDIWKTGSCQQDQDSCILQEDCASCVEMAECGWCDNFICLHGNVSGATDGFCQQWAFGTQIACGTLCDAYLNCFSCAEHIECGWCNNTVCTLAHENGTSVDNCISFDFNVTGSVCGTEPLQCNIHTNCDTCNADPSERCGWCEATKKCLEYDGRDQIPDGCQNWKPRSCLGACYDFSENCTACQENKGCIYCNETFCVEGDATGPANGLVCVTWGALNCPMDCSNNQNCNECSQYGVCGWCEIASNPESSFCTQANDLLTCQNQNGNLSIEYCPVIQFPCPDFNNCGTCTKYAYCSWCSDYGCVNQNNLPADTSCSDECSIPNPIPKLSLEWIIIIVFISFFSVLLIAFGVVFWYRLYWTKRHYYERLR